MLGSTLEKAGEGTHLSVSRPTGVSVGMQKTMEMKQTHPVAMMPFTREKRPRLKGPRIFLNSS